jgi:crotonobetainyl-CoA:carnitine CoA-transferase CaiB-like acyl-CoA transferase
MTATATRPLEGIRVLELGQMLAGPFAGCVLGYFGAEVIKVEPLTGDPIRTWRVLRDGTSLWWHSLARNKQSIAIDLQTERGRELVRDLASHADVLIENFRPGVMEKWGLGPDALRAIKADLIYTRVSGYGQTGPYSHKPGFASVCEALGGLRHVNGFPDRPPARPNLSLGDTLAGIHAVMGVLLALVGRLRQPSDAGQVVDVAIYESVFNMLEGVVPEFDGAGVVRGPSGSTVTGIAPTNTYRCADGKYVVIGANADALFQRLMRAMDREEMAVDPRFSNNKGRVEHEPEIDAAIATWMSQRDAASATKILEDAQVPAGPIYSVADMMRDPHFQARGLFHEVDAEGKPLKVPAMFPLLSATPGRTDSGGPKIGEHTVSVLQRLLKLSREECEAMREEKVVGF